MLAEEEATPPPKKASPRSGSKKAASAWSKPAGPGAIAAGDASAVAPSLSTQSSSKNDGETEQIESFAATGIDNALDLIDVVTAKMDKASVGNQAAATVEKHPEVRSCVGCCHLTFQHSPSAETIQGASFFPNHVLRFIFSPQGRIQRLRGSGTP